MAKLFFLVALCIAGALAVPNNADIKRSVKHTITPMLRTLNAIKSVDGDIAACYEAYIKELQEILLAAGAASRECVVECLDEVMQIHYDVYDSLVKAHEAVLVQVDVINACDNDQCVIDALIAIRDIAIQNAHDNHVIIEEGIKAIAAEYPEAWECTKGVFAGLKPSIQKAMDNFVDCINA